MIIGIGVDVVDATRIEKIYFRHKERFLDKILTASEKNKMTQISLHKALISYLAKRFSAKEAVAKAFGQGIGPVLSFKDIEILNNEHGAPIVNLPNWFLEKYPYKLQINISISDEWPTATSFVIVSRDDRQQEYGSDLSRKTQKS
ncbi:MAG: holo-ACP synthase [Rickettsiaceae bacterium]|nr:holo-ACP synthase [Rickettsiaceae bacterium]